mmetsp:Transcript_127265/g.189714  ORF Transcript_127265/g.189714 Transcript_127265/m.189714 type:complete len:83 (-) Transcript_127265:746-994(-)
MVTCCQLETLETPHKSVLNALRVRNEGPCVASSTQALALAPAGPDIFTWRGVVPGERIILCSANDLGEDRLTAGVVPGQLFS